MTTNPQQEKEYGNPQPSFADYLIALADILKEERQLGHESVVLSDGRGLHIVNLLHTIAAALKGIEAPPQDQPTEYAAALGTGEKE